MGEALQMINRIRKKADVFREQLTVYSKQREFDEIIDAYERIIEELVYESENKR